MGLLAGVGLSTPYLAAAQNLTLQVYPAMRLGGISYVISTGENGRIAKCEPIDTAGADATVRSACQLLTARGISRAVKPATPLTDPANWFAKPDLPHDSRQRKGTRKVEMLYEVSPQGGVRTCRVVKGSGDRALDKVACAEIVARGRFRPATFNGDPVPAIGMAAFSFTFAGG